MRSGGPSVPFMAFVLMAFLIAVAYYVGLVGDAGAVFGGLNTLANTLTGRNSSGQFATYPGGATLTNTSGAVAA